MTWPAPFPEERLDLLVNDRISIADAARQTETAREIVQRLATQPGLILADEVGMGKTFVALAVAMSAAWADKGRRPVVVMVPPSVKTKWQTDWGVFRSLCINRAADREMRAESAGNALELFRLLDDPPSRAARVIFLTHGAFHRNLQDPWVKLAILKFALHHAKLGDRRDALVRWAPTILRVQSKFADEELYRRLLQRDFDRWRETIAQFGDDPGDDPVPAAVEKALKRSAIDVRELRQRLHDLPLRSSPNIDDRLAAVRRSLNEAFQDAWKVALVEAKFRSPLLILDEAHHVKNAGTQLASLFTSEEAEADAGLLAGALKNRFERMLFLTATPFQLGHGELLEVVERFASVNWTSMPEGATLERFAARRHELRKALDEAQQATLALDAHWGTLRTSDVPVDDVASPDAIESWWSAARFHPAAQPERVQQVVRAFEHAHATLGRANELLRPWVIRHLRSRTLLAGVPRRLRLSGRAVETGCADETAGLPISAGALLPFLLAARAQAVVGQLARANHDRSAHYRATFAEGLASSYEGFLETRATADVVDNDGTPTPSVPRDPRLERYLQRLHASLPDESAFAEHPKVAAVARRVAELWERGEKVVVFCHYRVTGRALVKHISRTIDARLWSNASRGLGRTIAELRELAHAWNESFEEGRPLARTLHHHIDTILDDHGGVDEDERERIRDTVRRFVRTETFLARFVDLTAADRANELARVLGADTGGLSLRARLDRFVSFLTRRLTPAERLEYLEALERIHPGIRYEGHDAGEIHGGTQLLPNVRLASGAVPREVRERLLRGFNTPFLPEVLVASSVMAEGVDLHLNCRHIIHHDLDWNPSVIEQRTGRVDRIGAQAERVGRSIEVFLPYIGGTQDEKMFKVVMDRERWFQIIMGERYRTDELATELAAQRIPLPAAMAEELTLRLEVYQPPHT